VPTLILDTPEGIRLRTEIAGVGSRLTAALLDMIVVVASYIVLLLVLALINWGLSVAEVPLIEEFSGFVYGLLAGGILVVMPAYFIVCPMFLGGQTPGKRAVKIRVVSADGHPATAVQHLLRGLLWVVDTFLWVPAPLGLILISMTPSCRRLGDLAASTVVLYEARQVSREEPWPEELWSERPRKHLELTPGMASRMTDEDLVFLRDAILRREIPRGRRDALYREVVGYYAGVLGFEATDKTRLCLKELYLFGRESRG
jgi:uncharacterized RDD family membrane protein YckC